MDQGSNTHHDVPSPTPLEQLNMLDGALAWAAAGKAVIPVVLTADGKKQPLIRDWYYRATTTRGTIESWWKQWPFAVPGVLTGIRSHIVAVDVDPRNGGDDTLAQLPELPSTRIHSTMSGGRHYLFRYERSLRSGELGRGVDLQADKRQIVVPPSPGYAKVNNLQPVELPTWIVDRISARQGGGDGSFNYRQGGVSDQTNAHHLQGSRTTSEPEVIYRDEPESWLTSVLAYSMNDVRSAAIGTRNSTLYQKARRLGRYLAGGHFDEDEIRRRITLAAHQSGLLLDEIERTLDSALWAGKRRPIRVEQQRVGGSR
ncbi:bifunctional DNA primase/polymerase [Micromonospora sp. NPDC003241]